MNTNERQRPSVTLVCGGTFEVAVAEGCYEIRCTRCGTLTATGPAPDRHLFASLYANERCEATPGSGTLARDPWGPFGKGR